MQDKHNEDANWEDIDWGQVEPEAMPGPPATAARISIAQEKAVEPPPAAPAVPLPPENSPRKKPDPQPVREHVPRRGTPKTFVFTPTSVAMLTLTQEGQEEDTVVMVKDQSTVGRHAGNDLVIQDLHVSSRHAKFVCLLDGTFEIVDLNSSGGTFVNGEQVSRQALKSGDELEFATVRAKFRYVAGPRLESEKSMEGTLVCRRPVPGKKVPARKNQAVLIMPDGLRTVLPLCEMISIGRLPESDIFLNEPHVSCTHASLISSGGVFELFDLNSTCGTFVNGEPIQTRVLVNGDRIRFGFVECLFENG